MNSSPTARSSRLPDALRSLSATPPDASVDGADVLARFQQLERRRDELKNQRVRHEMALELAEREERECQAAAAAFGVHSLEELQALIVRERAADAQRLDAFEAALNQEEQLLNSIRDQVDKT